MLHWFKLDYVWYIFIMLYVLACMCLFLFLRWPVLENAVLRFCWYNLSPSLKVPDWIVWFKPFINTSQKQSGIKGNFGKEMKTNWHRYTTLTKKGSERVSLEVLISWKQAWINRNTIIVLVQDLKRFSIVFNFWIF